MKFFTFGLLIILTSCYTPAPLVDYTKNDLTLPVKNGGVYYEKVYNVDSVSKDDLFNRGRIWAVDYFNSAKDVLQIQDKNEGQLTGKGIFDLGNSSYDMGYTSSVKFTFNIQYKDGKYRQQFYDFIITSINTINGNSITSPFDSVYYHYRDHQVNKGLMESRANARQRYAHYIYEFKRNIALIDNSLNYYETGKHETDF